MSAFNILKDSQKLLANPYTGRSSQPYSREVAPLSPSKILVVDDEPMICEILKWFLVGEGHHVETAVDGEDGLQRFRACTWDMVLLDRAMPRMSGMQLALAIKQLNPHMPVVLVSGLPDIDEEGDASTAVDAVVRKPFTGHTLREGMVQAFRKHSST